LALKREYLARKGLIAIYFTKKDFLEHIISVLRIRIRIAFGRLDPDPDPGGQK
jgi:hypothetical protein